MKRRTADCGKLRRPLKRSKITEGIYGSTFLYLKFLLVWALVLMADFIIEFRFEYLWPFWLLLCSVYDSFKFQGLAFSVFFVCIAVTSDVVCYLFIPVQWLFFAASTYVWVQYVWHTERGICLPTVSLWLLFVYIEASVRLREFKSLPFNLDLCRPFAAHCIGYPVVTLGFGFKSYISYRLRLRKQKDVQKENKFYIQLLQQALPLEQQNVERQKALPSKQPQSEEVISNGVSSTPTSTSTTTSSSSSTAGQQQQQHTAPSSKKSSKLDPPSPPVATTHPDKDLKKANNVPPSGPTPHIEDFQYIEQAPQQTAAHKRHNNINNYTEENLANEQSTKAYKANGVTKASKLNSQKDNVTSSSSSSSTSTSRKGERGGGGKQNNTATTTYANNKDEVISRLESDIKRLKTDLQSSRHCEQELHSQISSLAINEKSVKSEVYQLRQDNESLQTKLHNLVTQRRQDKENLSILERKLQEERKKSAILEQQLITDRKTAKKMEEAAIARAIAMAAAARGECTDSCKLRRREMEGDMMQIRHEVKIREDQIQRLERETQHTIRQYKDTQNETEVLMSALAAMQDKTTHLESSLSAETKLKLELFSALGDAKRQIEIQQGHLARRELESDDYKTKIAELMAVNPSTTSFTTTQCSNTSPRFMNSYSPAPQSMLPSANIALQHMVASGMAGIGMGAGGNEVLAKSSLNPNACDYQPKVNQ